MERKQLGKINYGSKINKLPTVFLMAHLNLPPKKLQI